MRFPKRMRGLVAGSIVLVAGPVVAATLASSPVARVASVRAVAAVALTPADQTVKIESRPMMLRLHAPIPPPVAAPAPAPAPAPQRIPVRRPSSPRVVPTAVGPVDRNSIVGIILAAAARWGVDGNWMVSIARCESSLNPRAVNPRGPYIGLFQFLQSTFSHNGGTNIWDPADQANITAKMLAHGQAHQWSCA